MSDKVFEKSDGKNDILSVSDLDFEKYSGLLSGKKVKVPVMFRKFRRYLWIVMKILCCIKSIKQGLHVIPVPQPAFSGN